MNIKSSNSHPYFSIFTATYNRKELLPRAYESVKRQTFRDFEWVIIDDGSTDGTKELVKQWQAEAEFPIKYVWQRNGGKHIAFNAASDLVAGKIFLSLDSDDELVPETLERYHYHWENMEPEARKKVGCILSLVKDQEGNIVGQQFPVNSQVADFWYLYLVKNIRGEKGSAIPTEVYRKYLYPDHIRNVYIPEGIFLHRMSQDYKSYCINEALRIYWIDKREDHEGDKMLRKDNYPGNRLYHLAFMNNTIRLFWRSPRVFISNAIYYIKLSLHLGYRPMHQYRELKGFSSRLLWFMLLPVGFILFWSDK